MGWSAFRDAKTRNGWKRTLLERQRRLCALCGHRFAKPGKTPEELLRQFSPTFDHITPRSHGGTDEFSNLRLVHAACNQWRGAGAKEQPLPYVPKALHAPKTDDLTRAMLTSGYIPAMDTHVTLILAEMPRPDPGGIPPQPPQPAPGEPGLPENPIIDPPSPTEPT